MDAFTVSDVELVSDWNTAEIDVVPRFLAVARPLVLIEAIPVWEESQATTSVTFWVVPSEKLAVAVNCWASPKGIVKFIGLIEIEVADAELTETEAAAESDPEVTVIVVAPAASPKTKPWVGAELLIVATAVLDEVQFTLPVRFCLLPSL